MNKAFVKDEDAWEDPQIEPDPHANIPAGSRNYMIPQGAFRLRAELDDLIQNRHPQQLTIVNRMAADGLGPPDAAYREARKSLQRLERRIAFLTGRLSLTEVIDPLDQDVEHIRFGATVTVLPADGPEKVYRIVGIDEANIARGLISWTSPLARALLGAKTGDVVKVTTPAGRQELEIIDVCYREILLES